MTTIPTPDPEQILNLPLPDNDADAATVRDYLRALLHRLFDEDAPLKYAFGNSGWDWDLYDPLMRAGWAEGIIDADGETVNLDTRAARRLVKAAIDRLLPADAPPEFAPAVSLPAVNALLVPLNGDPQWVQLAPVAHGPNQDADPRQLAGWLGGPREVALLDHDDTGGIETAVRSGSATYLPFNETASTLATQVRADREGMHVVRLHGPVVFFTHRRAPGRPLCGVDATAWAAVLPPRGT